MREFPKVGDLRSTPPNGSSPRVCFRNAFFLTAFIAQSGPHPFGVHLRSDRRLARRLRDAIRTSRLPALQDF